jgi:DNA adenine methylase
MMEDTKIARPFLKWAGGKGRLLPQLSQFYPEKFNNYYEPFFGGGAVFFSLSHTGKSHINDINDTLMDAYAHVRDNIDALITILKKIEAQYKKLNEADRKEYYLKKRTHFNTLKSGVENTAILIFLNKTCFNGLYRENRKGEFNVPFGRYANPTICDEQNLRQASKLLRECTITCGSYISALSSAKKGDFVYLDPPYFPLSKTSSFTDYHEDGFTADDQRELRDLFVDLDNRGCYVMLSNSAAPYIKELYGNYRQESVFANRNINAHAAGRGKIAEIVALNY